MVDSVQVFDAGFRVLDATGAPVNDAKIKFRVAGPGATKLVYSDASLSTSLGHTVRTRSDGFPVDSEGSNTTVLIYTGPAAYHVEITDADDVVIFPAKDQVKGALDTSDFVTSADTSVLVEPMISKTADFVLDAGDKGKVFDCNAAGGFFTGTLPDPTVVGDGWNATIRNGGTNNPVGIASGAAINTPMGDVLAFSLRMGESVKIGCNGATFKIGGYVPPLLSGTIGIIVIADRITAAPVGAIAGARYIVTSPFSTYEAEDIIEATGQGTFFEITPPADCGWIAYVQDEDRYYSFQGTAWVLGLEPAASDTVLGLQRNATQAEMETPASAALNVTPSRMHYHPGVAKAWVLFNGNGTVGILASHNVSSITDNGVGDWTVNLAITFSSINYATLATGQSPTGSGDVVITRKKSVAKTTTAAAFTAFLTSAAADDASEVHVAFFGDL